MCSRHCSGRGRQEEERDASALREVLTQPRIISAAVQVRIGCTGGGVRGRTAPVVHRGIAGGFSEEVWPTLSSEAGAGVHLEDSGGTPLLGGGCETAEFRGTLNTLSFPGSRVWEGEHLRDQSKYL